MKRRSVTEELASFLMGMSYDNLPPAVIDKAKLCILDLFGAHFSGHDLESCQPIKDYISTLGDGSQATVWSMGSRTLATEAAFANGAISHSTVFDDMHAQTASHLGSIVIPAAIAVAESQNCSGKELLLAIVCGYEIGIRVGTGLLTAQFQQSGFRPSGTFGAFGSVASAGKLLKLNSEKMMSALGMAANVGNGLMAFVVEGTDDLIYHNGLASRNGILSALLARKGALATRFIFEVEGGFLKVYGGNSDSLEQIIGGHDRYKIEEVDFKSIPACTFVQSTAQAFLEISRARDFEIDDIDNIEVRIFPRGKYFPGCDNHGPFHGLMQARASNQYTAASILIHKAITFKSYTDFRDPAIQDLAPKIIVIEDEEAKSKWPEEHLVKVEVFLEDGSSRKALSRNPHFLSDQEVVEKCRSQLEGFLGVRSSKKFMEMVQSLEAVDNVNRLTKFLNEGLRSVGRPKN